MKKLLLILIVASCSCVNGSFEVPEQKEQDVTGNVTLIEFKF
jgi:hypothetical protein